RLLALANGRAAQILAKTSSEGSCRRYSIALASRILFRSYVLRPEHRKYGQIARVSGIYDHKQSFFFHWWTFKRISHAMKRKFAPDLHGSEASDAPGPSLAATVLLSWSRPFRVVRKSRWNGMGHGFVRGFIRSSTPLPSKIKEDRCSAQNQS